LNAYAKLTPDIGSNKRKPPKKKFSAATTAARCTEFRTPQKIARRQRHSLHLGRKSRTPIRCSITTRASSNISTVSAAVLLGKAAMIELAGGMGYRFANASLQGASKNPWKHPNCWTCGSSSGSAAIVGGGPGGFCDRTETWGSIICPSAYCGISGLRPTYGRVSRYGAMALSYSMDKIGPLARSAEDCARVFAAIAGHDFSDRGTLPIDKAAFTYSASLELAAKSPRIGILTNAWKKMACGKSTRFTAPRKSPSQIFPDTLRALAGRSLGRRRRRNHQRRRLRRISVT